MIRLRRKACLALGAAAAVLVGTGVIASTPATALGADTAASDIVTIPVSFSVVNSNNTAVACTSDGATYTIRGHITAPAGALVNPKSATLYLHAVTQGEFYWMFDGVPGYNFAQQMAGQGHIAVTIDRLGYGASDRPPGMSSCFGSQATTAHEVIQDLKAGTYTVGANPTLAAPVAFPTMFLVGHSAGGLIGTIESSTFHDVAGFVNFGWSDTTTSTYLTTELSGTEERCALNAAGMPSANGVPGYEPFGDSPSGILFYSATPAVRAALPKPSPDPCGDLLSIPAALAADSATVSTDPVPILLFQGSNDALFPAPDMQAQADRYVSSKDVTLDVLNDTAHGFNYESTHDDSENDVNLWLTAHGDTPFSVGAPAVVPAATAAAPATASAIVAAAQTPKVTKVAASRKTSTVKAAVKLKPSQASGTLAYTGLSPDLALGGLGALLTAGALTRRRRRRADV